jgi:hypothetical protein
VIQDRNYSLAPLRAVVNLPCSIKEGGISWLAERAVSLLRRTVVYLISLRQRSLTGVAISKGDPHL